LAAFAATMSSGVAVVVGRAGRLLGGEESVDSLPPARAGAEGGAAEAGRAGAAPPVAAGALVPPEVRARLGGGGGGGVLGRAVLAMVDADVPDAEGAGLAEAGLAGAEVAGVDRAAGDFAGADAGAGAGALAATLDVARAGVAAPIDPLPAAFFPEPLSAKKSRQMRSTLCGSARNCWYFSSTNQSFGPNSGTPADDTVVVRLF